MLMGWGSPAEAAGMHGPVTHTHQFARLVVPLARGKPTRCSDTRPCPQTVLSTLACPPELLWAVSATLSHHTTLACLGSL